MRWLARVWPAIVWAGVIALFSTHWFTDQNTGRIIFPLLHFFFPHQSSRFYVRADHLIRKGAHVTEYFIFSLILLHTIRGKQTGWRLAWALIAVLIVFGYACTDELHQSFVPGRGVEFDDVLLDTAAATAAQIVAGAWIALRAKPVAKIPQD